MTGKMTRRSFMIRCVQVSASGVVLSGMSACGESDGTVSAVCADLDDMTAGERAFRDSSGYQEESSIPSERCANCAYFSAPSSDSTCGSCEIFSGPANRNGHCDLWSEIS